MIKEIEYPSFTSGGYYRRISWGAVFAGAIMSLSTLVFLTALGAGLDWANEPRANQALILSLTMGGVLWTAASSIAAFYAGGWVAGRLTDIARVSESVIHGLASWAAATTVLAFVFTTTMVGALGVVSRAVHPTPGIAGADGAYDQLEIATEAGNRVAAGGLGFLMLACGLAAAGLGARAGTRMLRPVPMPEPRRERVAS